MSKTLLKGRAGGILAQFMQGTLMRGRNVPLLVRRILSAMNEKLNHRICTLLVKHC
jgi:hypothetical protein